LGSWSNYLSFVDNCNCSGIYKMNKLKILNELIQGAIVILLVTNAFNTKSLSLFQLIVTVSGLSFGFYARLATR